MKAESTAVLLRMFIGEQDKCGGISLYEYIVQYLRKNQFAGVTVVRGLEGYGKASIIHTANILDLSTDQPIVIEIVDTPERMEKFIKDYETWPVTGSALITQEKVKIIQYGHHKNSGKNV